MMHNSQKRKWTGNKMDIEIESKKQAITNYAKNNNKNNNRNNFSSSFEPRGINVLEYAEARAYEIQNLKKVLSEAERGFNVAALQKLPRHMRRRAGNHDVRRIPHRLRQSAVINMEKSKKEAKVKKESRRQRRKPKNLFQEYKKRQDKCKWLETHIWHAKRFYVQENWGYKIARNTFAKALRASYRAAKSHCLLQDVSFYESIEVTGKQTTILDFFLQIAPLQGDVLTFSSNTEYIVLNLYHFGKYPLGCIGIIKFLWTSDATNDGTRNGIVFCHPSIVSQFIHEVERFNTSLGPSQEKDSIHVNHNPMEFVILRLTGNQSGQFLSKVLSVSNDADGNLSLKKEISRASGRSIFNGVVKDPRIHIPKNKQNPTKSQVTTESEDKQKINEITPSIIKYSDIWNQSQRHRVSQSKQSDNDLNKMKESLLYVDGDEKSKQPIPSPDIPVCLLHNPGCNENSFSRGFELILPSNWAMPFWIALIYQGARAGGLQEAARVTFETGSLHFPEDFIDTEVGRKLSDDISTEKIAHYNRVPPAKRVSYKPLGVQCQHFIPWSTLVSDWALNFNALTDIQLSLSTTTTSPTSTTVLKIETEQQPFVSLRTTTITTKTEKVTKGDLKQESSTETKSKTTTGTETISFLSSSSPTESNISTFFVLRDTQLLKKFKNILSRTTQYSQYNQLLSDEVLCRLDITRALIPICVTTLGEGLPKDNAMLCIPSAQDYKDLKASKGDEFSEYHGPVEQQHRGPKHLYPFVYKQHSKELLIPNVQLTGRSTRWLMGFIKRGDYSLLKGKGTGVGFVSALALCFHFKMVAGTSAMDDDYYGDLVLFRNTNTLQYRFCKLEVIV